MSSVEEIIVDDNSDSVSYYPPDIWQSSSGSVRYGNSYHVTHEKAAYVTFSFNGSYIAYYSDKNSDHGDYSAYIDGKLLIVGNSYAKSWSPTGLLFGAELDPGTHTLNLTNSETGSWMGVDYFLSISRHTSKLSEQHLAIRFTGCHAFLHPRCSQRGIYLYGPRTCQRRAYGQTHAGR